MKKALFFGLAFIALFICSCDDKSKNSEESKQQEIHVIEFNNPDGTPVGTHRDTNGVVWHDNNLAAPKRGETREEYNKRMNENAIEVDPYEEGFEDGYKKGLEEGQMQE